MEKWGSYQTCKFVEEYYKHPCLWDATHRHYKDRDERSGAMSSIVSAMDINGFDISEARRKLKSIRTTYFMEKKKIANSRRSGAGAARVYWPKLAWFNVADQFLVKTFTARSDTNLGRRSHHCWFILNQGRHFLQKIPELRFGEAEAVCVSRLIFINKLFEQSCWCSELANRWIHLRVQHFFFSLRFASSTTTRAAARTISDVDILPIKRS